MKKILFLLIVLLASNFVTSQTSQRYHAIDGTVWTTKYDRDKKERLLWDKIDVNLRLAQASGRLGATKAKEYRDLMKHLFDMCRESFATLRLADSGKEILQNAEFRFFLEQNGVTAKIGVARNGEVFNMVEYANCFDSVIREYSFNSEIVEELANPDGREYRLDFVVNDFSERMEIVVDRIEREILAMDFKEDTIMRMVPRYRANQERLNKRDAKTK